MCRGVRDLTPLMAIAFWLFVVLPLIYLEGGPDEVIQRLTIILRPPMDVRDVASACSVIVAIGAALLAWEAIRRQTRTQKWLANHQLLMTTNDMIIEDPNLLAILGIDLDAAAQDGLSATELVFINTHLDASSVLYRISGEKPKLTEYRKNFLRHPKVRLAWRSYLRGRTQNPGPWMDAVDAYVREIEADEAAQNRSER
jgi:hypothetical protein